MENGERKGMDWISTDPNDMSYIDGTGITRLLAVFFFFSFFSCSSSSISSHNVWQGVQGRRRCNKNEAMRMVGLGNEITTYLLTYLSYLGLPLDLLTNY